MCVARTFSEPLTEGELCGPSESSVPDEAQRNVADAIMVADDPFAAPATGFIMSNLIRRLRRHGSRSVLRKNNQG